MSMQLVSSAPTPFLTSDTDRGLEIAYRPVENIKTGEDYRVHVHVFNRTEFGLVSLTNTSASCFYHLYNSSGWDTDLAWLEFELYNGIDFASTINGSNFERGYHTIIIQCNSTDGASNYVTGSFEVNDYGEALTDAQSHTFNYSMIFMMILFISALVGLFKVENYIGKFALYWVCHLLFIAGTFSVWQFNSGYAVAFVGLAGVFKILFWVGIVAVLPMILLSLAWIFYIHTFNEHFQKLVDKGMDTESAFRMSKRKSGGWFNGK